MCRELTKRKSLRAMFRRFRRSDDASVTIEFGFVAPVFFLLVLVFIETAAMMFTEYAMDVAVSEAARQIRTGQAQSAKWSSTEFKVETCKVAKLIPDCYSTLKVFVDSNTTFTAISATAPSFADVGTDSTGVDQNTTFKCGVPLEVVTVITTYDRKFILPAMGFFANTADKSMRRLTATAVFRNEPFVATNSCSAIATPLPTPATPTPATPTPPPAG
jgi:Flp pilus assembly protein TadG